MSINNNVEKELDQLVRENIEYYFILLELDINIFVFILKE